MKDIPMFTSEHGVASLYLREIPFSGEARIRIQASCDPKELLNECIAFCVACGAEQIFATGDPCLLEFPVYTNIVQLQASAEDLGESDAKLFPVQDHTVAKWRDIYNVKMKNVPNSSFLSSFDEKEIVTSGEAYFIHRNGELVGIGRISGSELSVIAACAPGGGKDAVRCLAALSDSDCVFVTVSDKNRKAMDLYKNLGFLQTKTLDCWYRVK